MNLDLTTVLVTERQRTLQSEAARWRLARQGRRPRRRTRDGRARADA